MYTQAEASLIKKKFWTCFGMYMSPVPSFGTEKVNWINYKTGVKGIEFKMNVERDSTSVMIEINLPDTMLQHQYFNIFNTFMAKFKSIAGNDWIFYENHFVKGKGYISLIAVELKNVNVFREEDWPTIISFLKQNIIGLDKFWTSYKPAFELA